MAQQKKMETKAASAAPAAAEHVTPNTAIQPEKEYLEMQKTNIPATESVLEVVERFVAQDKLLADSEEDDECYDDGEGEDGDSTVDEAAAGTREEILLQEANDLELNGAEAEEDSPEEEEVSAAPAISTKEIVRGINEIARRTVEMGKMEIGQYVLDQVFGGNLQTVLTKNPTKSKSMRSICDDPELLVDHRRLGSWVRAAALRSDLKNGGLDISKFNFTHFLALLRLGKKERRLDLARRIAEENLSVRQTLDEVNNGKKKSLNNALNNSKGSQILKRLAEPLSLLEDQDEMAFLSDTERLEKDLDSESRLRIIKELDVRSKKIIECSEFLAKTKNSLVAIEMAYLNGHSE